MASIINKLNKTTCVLDPSQTKLLMSRLSSIINVILRIVNLCFSSGVFPEYCKYFFLIYEKAIATQIHSHRINDDIVDNVHSAYKAGHSCETALLRVYNHIVTNIGRRNGDMLVLLDLSANFNTIDHDHLFNILEKYVRICGNALKLIMS